MKIDLSIRKYILKTDGYDMGSNLRFFLFRNFIGISYCYGDKQKCLYRILNYGNTIDFEIDNNLYNNLTSINPLNLANKITIENNIFNYKFIGIKIISIPDKDFTGLQLTKKMIILKLRKMIF